MKLFDPSKIDSYSVEELKDFLLHPYIRPIPAHNYYQEQIDILQKMLVDAQKIKGKYWIPRDLYNRAIKERDEAIKNRDKSNRK